MGWLQDLSWVAVNQSDPMPIATTLFHQKYRYIFPWFSAIYLIYLFLIASFFYLSIYFNNQPSEKAEKMFFTEDAENVTLSE